MLSISRQCDLLGLSKGALYYNPVAMDPFSLELMDQIDRQYLKTPFYGSRRMTVSLATLGYEVNRKRIQRLMRLMGLEAIYPKPNLSKPCKEHKVYPYLLKNLVIQRPNQVWATDITYLRVGDGFAYLMAIMDLFSRFVLAWRVSNTMDVLFCKEALKDAFRYGYPEIFNSDQGAQFTANEWLEMLLGKDIKVSMDSKGRYLDNIFVERLWRTVKYEEVYLKGYEYLPEAVSSLGKYFKFYNGERPHQSLGNQPPKLVYETNKWLN